ncbi:hypothetical protein NL676_022145 [Syzygium grande]|nr:hypothetical protein NL676_022145 [Syzygium grande]
MVRIQFAFAFDLHIKLDPLVLYAWTRHPDRSVHSSSSDEGSLCLSCRLDNLKHVQASEIDNFIKDLHTLCRTNTYNVQNGSSKVVVISQLLELLTLNIIIRMIASKRYFGLSSASTGSSTDDGEASHLRKVIQDMMYISGFPAISDLLTFAGWTDCVGTVKTMKRVGRELDEIIGKWVEEHKLKRGDDQRGDAMDVQEDFIDVMLSVIGEGLASFGHSPETIVKATVMNIIVAASDPTSLNLTWALSLLLNNKHVMERAQEEIDLKVGKGKWVQDSDIERLPYLQAIVKETLRLYPPGPVLVPHETRADCTINSYLILKDTWIFVNAWKLQRDPRVWSNPEKFSPERFLTSHSGVDASGQHFEFIPFGSARRSCPGASFALRFASDPLDTSSSSSRIQLGNTIGRTGGHDRRLRGQPAQGHSSRSCSDPKVAFQALRAIDAKLEFTSVRKRKMVYGYE